jgi:hypothetical protein
MTDEQYLQDLEAAAAAVGEFPADYSQLRDLLASLPPGTPPNVRQAGADRKSVV